MTWTGVSAFAASGTGRSWQGVASDGVQVWLISDRTTQTTPHSLSNNIDTFNRAGTLLDTSTGIYTGTAPISGHAWNFVDGYFNQLDGYLYICCTNYHSNSYNETECQILVLNPGDWSIVTSYQLTTFGGSIESLSRRGTEWWVSWSGTQSIRRYNSDFSTLIGTYVFPKGSATPFGHATIQWWNGLEWDGDSLYCNLHGDNEEGGTYAPGLVEAWWNGSNFELVNTHTPPDYGAGQGFCRVPGTREYWFADRPGQSLIKAKLDNPGAMTFNGTSGYVNAKSGAAIDDLASGAFTVSAWITPTTTGEEGTGRIATKRPNLAGVSDAAGGWLWFTDGTASLGFITVGAAGAALAQQRGAANQITLGARQHVLVTYDDAGDRRGHIYVNGAEISYTTNTAGTATPATDAAGDFLIGNNGNESRTFNGVIEDLAVWDSVLSGAQITSLAGGTRPDSVGAPVLYAPNISALYPTLSDLQAVSITATTVQATYDYVF